MEPANKDAGAPDILLRPHQKLVLASGNAGKLKELRAVLGRAPLSVISVLDIDPGFNPDETSDSFAGNARIKALTAAHATDMPSLADDSGFCIEGLEGRPGAYSARFVKECGGRQEAFERLNREIQERAEACGGDADEFGRAHFVAAFCLAMPDGRIWEAEESCDGRFVYPPRGAHGHGFDPVFVPAGADKTFGQMTDAQKDAVSHRGKTLRRFLAECVGAQIPD